MVHAAEGLSQGNRTGNHCDYRCGNRSRNRSGNRSGYRCGNRSGYRGLIKVRTENGTLSQVFATNTSVLAGQNRTKNGTKLQVL